MYSTKHHVDNLDFPAANGGTITQGHANYCAEFGHAYHRVNGVQSPWCARCGDAYVAPAEPTDKPYTLVLLPAGFTALALYGGQTVTEVWDRYADDVVSSIPAPDHGNRPHLPVGMRDVGRAHLARTGRPAGF